MTGEMVSGRFTTSRADWKAMPRKVVQPPRPKYKEGRVESGGG